MPIRIVPRAVASALFIAAATLPAVHGAAAQNPSASALALAGLPDTNRPWTGQDYQKAAELLGKRGVALPVSSDRRGGIIIQRLTSLDNLAPLRKDTPAAARLLEASKIMSGSNAILSLYLAAMTSKTQPPPPSYSDELIRQIAFTLHGSAVYVDLIDELQAASPQDDRGNPGRAEAFKKIRAGIAATFVGASNALAQREYYSESELSILLDALAATLPRAKKVFDADSARAILANVDLHKSFTRDPRDIQKAQAMMAELNQLDLGEVPRIESPRTEPPRTEPPRKR